VGHFKIANSHCFSLSPFSLIHLQMPNEKHEITLLTQQRPFTLLSLTCMSVPMWI